MKYSTDPIFEAYSNHRKKFILEQSVASLYASDPLQEIRDLYQYDLECIEELMTEGMLGDAFSKVKGGISKATSFVANKGLQLLFSLIKKTATPEELEEIKKLQDPKVLEQKAKEGKELLKGSQSKETTNNESVFLNKSFFASILTESNIETMLEKYAFVSEQLLAEAMVGARKAGSESPFWKQTTQAKKQKKETGRRNRREASLKNLELAKLAKAVADGLKKKYDSREINRFLLALDNQVSQRAPITSLRQRPTDVPAGGTSLATRASQELERSEPKGGGELSKDGAIDIESEVIPSQTSKIPSPELPYSGESAPQEKKKEGLIRKAINWVKANPKRTAGTLVGIIAAIGVAVGGPAVLLPMLAKAGLGSTALGAAGGAISGAGLGAAKNIAAQGFSNKKFSAKSLGKSALKGAAFGAATGAIGGATNIADQDVSADIGDSGTGDVDTTEVGGDSAETGDTEYAGDTGDVSATPDDFEKYNGEALDPKSWRDKIKMSALDKLKREGGGQIDAEKYNSFVKKLVAMGKGAQGKSIDSIMGESYTVHYLSLLR